MATNRQLLVVLTAIGLRNAANLCALRVTVIRLLIKDPRCFHVINTTMMLHESASLLFSMYNIIFEYRCSSVNENVFGVE